jgi:hypothetical protein
MQRSPNSFGRTACAAGAKSRSDIWLAGAAVVLICLGLTGCVSPMQELNWIEHRVARNRPPRPSPLEVATVDPPRTSAVDDGSPKTSH